MADSIRADIDRLNEECGNMLNAIKCFNISLHDVKETDHVCTFRMSGLDITVGASRTFTIGCEFFHNGRQIREKLKEVTKKDPKYKSSCAWLEGDQLGVILIVEKFEYEKVEKLKDVNASIGVFE